MSLSRWITSIIITFIVFIALANLAGPQAWASPSNSPADQATVPTRTPTGAPQPTVRPTNTSAPREPTDTPILPATATPASTVPAETIMPLPTATVTLTPAASASPSATVTATPTTSGTPNASATIAPSTTTSAPANALTPTPATSAVSAGQTSPGEAAPTAAASGTSPAAVDNSTTVLGLIAISALLVIVGGFFLFGRRKRPQSK